jgi:hypothetical protein
MKRIRENHQTLYDQASHADFVKNGSTTDARATRREIMNVIRSPDWISLLDKVIKLLQPITIWIKAFQSDRRSD